jgi:hypothetical protein
MPNFQEKILGFLRLVRRSYFHQFPIFIFIGLGIILLIGVIFIGKNNFSVSDLNLWIASLASLILLISAVSYYVIYFSRYQILIDAYTQQDYYYNIYRSWGITFFNILFICSFALIGTVFERLISVPIFGKVTFEQMVLFFFREIIDDGTFGLLDAFGVEFYTIPIKLQVSIDYQFGSISSKFSWSDLLASVYVYITSLTIALAFWASIVAELVDWIQLRREVAKLFETRVIEPEQLSSIEIKRSCEILRYIRIRRVNISEYESKIIYYLKHSKSKEVRDRFFEIMSSTENMVVFVDCLNYFKVSPDKRFNQVCEKIKIKHSGKRRLIEEFESRQIKKLRWRGRPRRPNS